MENQEKEEQHNTSAASDNSKKKTIADLAQEVKQEEDSGREPVINLTGINKQFDLGRAIVQILKDIDVKIFPGEFIVILGPSGSGKSTLLNTLLGLEPPTSGKVMVGGIDFTELKQDKIAKHRHKLFGIVFQRSEWVRSINVLHNVALPLAINGVGKKERLKLATEKLTMVGMETHMEYTPTELSGGQQQKVTLARALVNDPEIIIADEPTGNLDSSSADKVMALLKSLNEDFKKTIIMVTHNIDYVRFASRTIYIRDGKIIQGSEQFLAD